MKCSSWRPAGLPRLEILCWLGMHLASTLVVLPNLLVCLPMMLAQATVWWMPPWVPVDCISAGNPHLCCHQLHEAIFLVFLPCRPTSGCINEAHLQCCVCKDPYDHGQSGNHQRICLCMNSAVWSSNMLSNMWTESAPQGCPSTVYHSLQMSSVPYGVQDSTGGMHDLLPT